MKKSQNLVSCKKFAQILGISSPNVTKMMNGKLKDAKVGTRVDLNHPCIDEYMQNRHNRATMNDDVLHDDIKKYVQSVPDWSFNKISKHFKIGHKRAKRIVEAVQANDSVLERKTTNKSKYLIGSAAKNESKKHEEAIEEDLDHLPEDIREFANYTLSELVFKFGTDIRFVDWLKATKSIEDIMAARLKNSATKSELISRNLVQIGVLEPVTLAHHQLLTDGSKTIARRVCAMNSAGRRVEDCEKFVSEQISSFIRPMKAKIAKTIKSV
jgi:hypothetical protein